MTRTQTETHRKRTLHRLRGWTLALVAIAGWLLLVSNSAEAQETRIPEIVLAQVLGPAAARGGPSAAGPATAQVGPSAAGPATAQVGPSAAGPAAAPAPSDPTVALVAMQMRERFAEQLVAGVGRPSVELEVHFDFDSDEVHEESAPQIEAAAAVLVEHFPETRFRVAGYADAAGSADYNLALSRRRARAVYRELVESHGVSPERLESVGFGEDASAEMTDAERRRVELQILRATPSAQ